MKEMNNPTRDLFNVMKGLGKFAEYKDYAEYRRKKFGIDEDSTESHQEFIKGLTDEELEDYNYIFDNENQLWRNPGKGL